LGKRRDIRVIRVNEHRGSLEIECRLQLELLLSAQSPRRPAARSHWRGERRSRGATELHDRQVLSFRVKLDLSTFGPAVTVDRKTPVVNLVRRAALQAASVFGVRAAWERRGEKPHFNAVLAEKPRSGH